MFTGGSDDEAVCIRVKDAYWLVQARAVFRKECAVIRVQCNTAMSTTVTRPTESFAKDLVSASVPARGGYAAISIQDYTRISNARGEFLNFLLAPNPEGVPATDYGVLKAA